jgi:hypothetical protein
MGVIGDVYTVLVGKPEGGSLLGNFGIGGRIILKWISKKWGWSV